ncbi:hypothetical protein EVAR_34562_1 [Eumeta japonica]|uniref:Uncharacterized protein n=1 Tax=Eumeta variegata TaxID=151549 RepID=A0A4C1X879_EUMVA|nr:hypothetical protein EVAR_34562_1 [Eumeta japonica]
MASGPAGVAHPGRYIRRYRRTRAGRGARDPLRDFQIFPASAAFSKTLFRKMPPRIFAADGEFFKYSKIMLYKQFPPCPMLSLRSHFPHVVRLIHKEPSNTDPSRFIGLALTKANDDAGMLTLSYQKDYLNL